MALHFNGMPCVLCERSILQGEGKTMFMPLFANSRSPLFVFNDAVVHTDCLARHPFGPAALADQDRAVAQRARPIRCDVCGLDAVPSGTPSSEAPDVFARDFLMVQRISEDESAFAARFNFLKAHRACLSRREKDVEMSQALDSLARTSEWSPEDLRHLRGYLRL